MRCIKRWYHLSNGYWLKVLLTHPMPNCWTNFGRRNEYTVDVAIGKTKRKVNDHYNCSRHSPKSMYLKSTNHKGGLEAFRHVMDFIDEYSTKLPKGSVISIQGSDAKREHVYSRVLRYGFIEAAWFTWYDTNASWNRKKFYFKEI